MAARALLALDDVAAMPAPGLSAPHQPAAPPDSAAVSRDETLRRERQRQMGLGITSYAWTPTRGRAAGLLYPLQGDLYYQAHVGAPLTLLVDKARTGAAGGAILDPQVSPDGRYVAFVQDKELYVVPTPTGQPSGPPPRAVQVTRGARAVDGLSNGLACFLTQEELGRFRGFWWSPDSAQLAFEQVDERAIPKYRIMHSGSATPTGDDVQEDHRYPFAGGRNPTRRLGVIKLPREAEQEESGGMQSGGAGRQALDGEVPTPVWMDFASLDTDFYISRVNWLPDMSLGVQKLNRLQTEVSFLRFDVETGQATTLLEETNPVWVNASYLYRNIEVESKNAFRFLWASERSGFMHLYLYEYMAGARSAWLLGAVTSGEWNVESVEGIDLTQGRVYFCGTADSPLERHLYVTLLSPVSDPPPHPIRLTGPAGMHNIVMDSSCRMFVDVYSNLTTPPRALVCTVPSEAHIRAVKPLTPADPSSAAEVAAAPSAELTALFQVVLDSAYPLTTEQEDLRVAMLQAQGKLCIPKIISVPTRDGKETLFGAVYLPDSKVHGEGPYPTMVSVYGGPHVQRVARTWAMTADMRAQRFRDMGYAVLKVDNRGSFRRGSAFEGAIKHCMGTVEILDQEDGVRKLVDEGVTIKGRVGIYGWSYGGYMAALCLMKAPETFNLAIAGAPVTSWDGYDTCYTERYMSTPQLNPTGYRNGSVMEAVGNMRKGQKLLLIHGLIDENVHFRHTARLITALINARKHYDLLLFPGERHSPRHLEDRIYMEQRIAEYVENNV
ncbi:unnamed protein product [Hyaloperonospora brassicae]|uniref:Peptidase S9 prolyl oligopeptidase catalytic domain-containing protein n=1 Tax=Hyaloperonospora brassicae TaxID=162125 RepID=A0AAV0TZD2_HYABA|nr:unnamed protein product [Hyaloperonospora brassicae]